MAAVTALAVTETRTVDIFIIGSGDGPGGDRNADGDAAPYSLLFRRPAALETRLSKNSAKNRNAFARFGAWVS